VGNDPTAANPHTPKTIWPSLVGVFAFGLTVRLWHVLEIRSAPFFSMRLGDSLSYHNWAVEIVNGNWLGNEVFYQAPLYPYALAVVYSLFGTSRLAVMLVQVVFGAVSCVLICDATTRLHSRRAGIAAGLVMGCYAPSIFFDGLIQKTAADQFLLCLLINLVIRWQHHQWLRTAVLIGFATGLLILSRENALVFVVAITLGMVLWQKPNYRVALLSVGVFMLGLTTILFPVAVRNYVVGKEFHLTTSQLGPNFFIGNNKDANGMYQPLRDGGGNAQRERRDATMLAERAAGRSLTPGQVSQYWTDRTLTDIFGDPGRWLRLMCWKLAILFNRVEVTDTEDLYSYSEWSTPLKLLNPVFHFGVLGPLAIVGYCLNWQRRRELMLLVLMVTAYAAGVWFFYVVGRYRFPLVPFLCLFAGIGIVDAGRLFSSRFRRKSSDSAGISHASLVATIVSVCLLISAFVFCNWPFLNADMMKSISQFNIAVELDVAGNNEEAIRFYRRSLELNPDDLDAHMNLADVLARTGRLADATNQFELALEFEYAPAGLHFNLAGIYARLGRRTEAARHYRQTIHFMPDFVPAWLNLGVALQQQGLTAEAIEALQQAVALDPEYLEAHLNLGQTLAVAERYTDAIHHFKAVLKLNPRHPTAQKYVDHAEEMRQRQRTQ
jgi:cytochrome c-type biogenesis protein CcmH/NrfG